jgi:hypothetical protein
VVGIVLTAVADAPILDAPLGPTTLAVAPLICGGPAVFLIDPVALLSAAALDLHAPRQQYQTPLASNQSHHSIRKHAPIHGTET